MQSFSFQQVSKQLDNTLSVEVNFVVKRFATFSYLNAWIDPAFE